MIERKRERKRGERKRGEKERRKKERRKKEKPATAIPTSARFKAGASFTPSPVIPHLYPSLKKDGKEGKSQTMKKI